MSDIFNIVCLALYIKDMSDIFKIVYLALVQSEIYYTDLFLVVQHMIKMLIKRAKFNIGFLFLIKS